MRLTEEQFQALQRRQTRPGNPVPKSEPARRKYGNRPTVVDGQQFDSIREAERYNELKLLEQSGVITGLRTQVRYPIVIGGIEVCLYVADFVYVTRDQAGIQFTEFTVVEDVKSKATRGIALYKLKRKLMAAVHGINIQEVL